MLCCHFRRLLAQLGVGEHQREFQASSGSFGWGLEGFTVVCLPGNALLLLGLPQAGWKVVYWAVVPPTHTHTYTDRQTDRHKRMQTNTRRDRQTHNDKQEGTRNTTSSRSAAQSMCASAQRQQNSQQVTVRWTHLQLHLPQTQTRSGCRVSATAFRSCTSSGTLGKFLKRRTRTGIACSLAASRRWPPQHAHAPVVGTDVRGRLGRVCNCRRPSNHRHLHA